MKIKKTTVIIIERSDMNSFLLEKKLITEEQKISNVSYDASSQCLIVTCTEGSNLDENVENLDEALGKPITNLDISLRTLHYLKGIEFKTLRDLIKHSKKDLLNFRGFGSKTIENIEKALQAEGLKLAE